MLFERKNAITLANSILAIRFKAKHVNIRKHHVLKIVYNSETELGKTNTAHMDYEFFPRLLGPTLFSLNRHRLKCLLQTLYLGCSK